MSTYIGLLNFTDKGIQSVKDSPKRAAAAKEMAGRFGVTMKDIYWTLGSHDIVCVLEAPDDASVTVSTWRPARARAFADSGAFRRD